MSFIQDLFQWAIAAAATEAKQAALQTTHEFASQLLEHLHEEAPDVAAQAEKKLQDVVSLAIAGIQSRTEN